MATMECGKVGFSPEHNLTAGREATGARPRAHGAVQRERPRLQPPPRARRRPCRPSSRSKRLHPSAMASAHRPHSLLAGRVGATSAWPRGARSTSRCAACCSNERSPTCASTTRSASRAAAGAARPLRAAGQRSVSPAPSARGRPRAAGSRWRRSTFSGAASVGGRRSPDSVPIGVTAASGRGRHGCGASDACSGTRWQGAMQRGLLLRRSGCGERERDADAHARLI